MTPRLLNLAIRGRVAGLEREYRDRAFFAWHAGLLSNFKKPPALLDFMGVERKAAGSGRAASSDIDTVMRQWRFAMAPHGPPPKPPRRVRMRGADHG